MRITSTSTSRGNFYRFYRSDPDFHLDLKPLAPLLMASGADIVVCSDEDEPGLLLTVGPLGGEPEAELRRRAKRHLAARDGDMCPAALRG
jgi:hypothetical protein